MIEAFCPNEYRDRIEQIDLESLKKRGINALILDVDNTLVAWNSVEPAPGMRRWVKQARTLGFRMCIVSNGYRKRVHAVASALGIPAACGSGKPRKKPFQQALEIMGSRPEQTAVVGDQIFTDIFGGNRLNLYTILVPPVSTKDFCTTRIMRKLEKYIIGRLRKKGLI